MKAALVLTTIHSPDVLESYYSNFHQFGHLDDVTIYCIPDKKTPREAKMVSTSLIKRGLSTQFPTLDVQDNFLRRLGLPSDFLPYNSDSRRNVGYLMALADNCDFLISIDDDYFAPTTKDVYESHRQCTRPYFGGAISTQWVNPCDALIHSRPLFQRGFPYFARAAYSGYQRDKSVSIQVLANMGLWTTDPDVDAIAWLSGNVHKIKLADPREFGVLSLQSWMPINSQNTAVARAAIPAYFFPTHPGRGDILQGYFLQACLKAVGATTRFGAPVVDHRRNTHNYLKDAKDDLHWIIALEEALPILLDLRLDGPTVWDAYWSLAHTFSTPTIDFSVKMTQWARACKEIGV